MIETRSTPKCLGLEVDTIFPVTIPFGQLLVMLVGVVVFMLTESKVLMQQSYDLLAVHRVRYHFLAWHHLLVYIIREICEICESKRNLLPARNAQEGDYKDDKIRN